MMLSTRHAAAEQDNRMRYMVAPSELAPGTPATASSGNPAGLHIGKMTYQRFGTDAHYAASALLWHRAASCVRELISSLR